MKHDPWKIECFLEDLFLGSQWSIILGVIDGYLSNANRKSKEKDRNETPRLIVYCRSLEETFLLSNGCYPWGLYLLILDFFDIGPKTTIESKKRKKTNRGP